MMTTTTTMMMMVMMMLMEGVWGHGMMLQPIQRSSMWREPDRFPTAEENFDDNQLFCGGTTRQWNINGGKCGPCGDPYDDPRPRENEAGGKYGKGIIVENYTQGQMIDVTIRITANHLGYFVFKLCPNNDITKLVEQACLDRYVLKAVTANGALEDKFYIGTFRGNKTLRLQLPSDVTCSQCVLQWTYNAGNSWNCFPNKTCCMGCGPQENFVNCADISISPSSHKRDIVNHAVTNTPAITTSSAASTTTTTRPNPGASVCAARPPYNVFAVASEWCHNNCFRGYCPDSICVCRLT